MRFIPLILRNQTRSIGIDKIARTDNAMQKGPTAGIILAAGESRRLGKPKQLIDLGGRPIVEWVVDTALASNLDRVVLVLGRDHRTILDLLADKAGHPRLEAVFNPRFEEGQSSSLRAGLLNVCDQFSAAMFLLGDQPLVDAALINLLLERFGTSDKTICVPSYAGRRGNPTLFGSPLYPLLLEITGDKGARQVIAAHPREVLEVNIEDPTPFLDIDTREDFERIDALVASRGGG